MQSRGLLNKQYGKRCRYLWFIFLLSILTGLSGAQAARVSDGQIALYTFGEGSGVHIADTSGVTPPLDLTVWGSFAVFSVRRICQPTGRS